MNGDPRSEKNASTGRRYNGNRFASMVAMGLTGRLGIYMITDQVVQRNSEMPGRWFAACDWTIKAPGNCYARPAMEGEEITMRADVDHCFVLYFFSLSGTGVVG
jgi:hypothetical protein